MLNFLHVITYIVLLLYPFSGFTFVFFCSISGVLKLFKPRLSWH